jgi:hypothetical protein
MASFAKLKCLMIFEEEEESKQWQGKKTTIGRVRKHGAA